MTSVPDAHREEAGLDPVACAVITCSDTRSPETDTSGALMRDLLTQAGHVVVRYQIVREEVGLVEEAVRLALPMAHVILLNGGTGISPRDGTVEAVQACLDRELPGFGELFRMLSHREIGSAAMLSRAVAGVAGESVIFATPGSTAAVRLAMTELIIPELRHLKSLLGF